MKFAYADPPYIGRSSYYKKEASWGGEVDHQALVGRLMHEFPDGWALSCSSPSLQQILAYCPKKIRVMAWVKPFASFKSGINPAFAWEPVLVWGGRKRGRKKPTIRDWISQNITLQKGLVGAKPAAFCFWIFEVLGAEAGDELVDLFPGTGVVGRCWAEFTRPRQLELRPAPGTCCLDMAPDRLDGIMAKCKGCSSQLVRTRAYGWQLAEWPNKPKNDAQAPPQQP